MKGLSPLNLLPSFDVINGVVIDYMHCLLEGIGKKLIHLWLTPSNPFYIGRQTELINLRLLSIRPPDNIARTPRGLDDLEMERYKKINQ